MSPRATFLNARSRSWPLRAGGVWPIAVSLVAMVAIAVPLVLNGDLPGAGQRATGSDEGAKGDLLCAPGCHPVVTTNLRSIDMASGLASFTPALPSAIVSRFPVTDAVELLRPVDSPSGREVHNDAVTVRLRDPSGRSVAVSQGFPALPGIGLYLTAPDDAKGALELDGRIYYWVRIPPHRSAQDPVFVSSLPTGGIVVAWNAGTRGGGLAVSGTGEVLIGSPFSFSLLSDSLSLEELVALAASPD